MTTQEKDENTAIKKKGLHFFVYCLAFIWDGFILGFPGSIYVELRNKLGTSIFITSWIYSSMSIGYIISTLITGYLADRIQKLHRLHATVIFISSIAIICVPIINNLYAMFIVFVIIGIGWAENETSLLLFVFRLYPLIGGKMYFWCAITLTTAASLSPLIVELSLELSDTFLYPFIIFGALGIIHSFIVIFLTTPQHDKLRAIKREAVKSKSSLKSQTTSTTSYQAVEMNENDHETDADDDGIDREAGKIKSALKSPTTSSTTASYQAIDTDHETDAEYDGVDIEVNANSASSSDLDEVAKKVSQQLKTEPNYKLLQNLTFVLLVICLGCNAAFQRGLVSFISTYTDEYLGIGTKYGRYFIICFFVGGLSARVNRQIFYSNSTPVYEVFGGIFIRVILMIIFIIHGKDEISLFILFGLMGIANGCFVPGILGWGELIKPTTGLMACMWWVTFGVFDAVMSLVMGALIEKYSASIIPIVVLVPVIIMLILNGVSVIIFRKIKEKERKVYEQVTK